MIWGWERLFPVTLLSSRCWGCTEVNCQGQNLASKDFCTPYGEISTHSLVEVHAGFWSQASVTVTGGFEGTRVGRALPECWTACAGLSCPLPYRGKQKPDQWPPLSGNSICFDTSYLKPLLFYKNSMSNFFSTAWPPCLSKLQPVTAALSAAGSAL